MKEIVFVENFLAPLNDTTTASEIAAERTVLKSLGGGCQLPIGAYAKVTDDGQLSLIGTVCHPEGKLRIVESASGKLDNAHGLGKIVAEKLRNSGANELLRA